MPNISIPNINDELIRLWDQENGEDKIRASLFNLIVYVQDPARLKESEDLVKHVISKFPSRVIFLVINNKPEEESLNVQVSSQTIGEGDLKIFCEMIRIEANGSTVERVPFLIFPQILPDLPVYLLWTQDPSTDNVILPHLIPYATRIIFNAESTHNLHAFASSLLSLSHKFHCELGDLHWNALEGWRRVLMESFNTKERFLSLGRAHHIFISYNKPESLSHQQVEIQAAYLQAWLASQLNLNFETFELVEGNIRLSYRRPMHEVVVLLRPTHEPALPAGAIVKVEISSVLNNGHHLFERHPQLRQVIEYFSDNTSCDLPNVASLQVLPPGQEIIQEIFYPQDKTHYLNALRVLSAISWRHQ
ncbi:MAG: glucose-6-phosphate dehydrogenase assembly protein OpcA [Verrucomicrobia bacterium]|nr:glucose-6-phosphate dehydrogenase assembly protein OpcA [Verrucomicrobiota bacterium]MBS0647407.1 glucose-6-phosphate dehydrogenase assembly protein OpcA [Verrucomicrobiota bacterium]